MTDPLPFETNIVYCPHCDEDTEEFEFRGLVKELGNILRYRFKKCGKEFEALPPDIMPNRPEDLPQS